GAVDQGAKDPFRKILLLLRNQSGVDFWPGPLSTLNATTNSTVVAQYDRVWKINKSDIDTFLTNIANGNVQNGTYVIPNSILNWPSNGDITQNQDLILAPFVDVNGDMAYDPTTGDYPLIKGDQAIYTIFNDSYLPHGSGGATIGAEIHLMAYAYGPCSITSSNSFLNYTTFYNYKIINRNSFAYLNSYVSLFNDSDIGSVNNNVGCDVIDHYGFTYNTAMPANQPAVGVVQLKGPVNTTNGIDDNGDGMYDEFGEQISMTNFMYFNNSFPAIPLSQNDPNNSIQYYQYMMSYWKDGTPLTCGGNGYGGSAPTNFAYPGTTNSNGACGGNWVETGSGSDKRFVMSSGPYEFQSGMITELEYAYITAFDSITNDPLGKLDSDVQNLHAIYNSSLNQCLTTGIKTLNVEPQFTIAPNPTQGFIYIKSNSKWTNTKIEISDALGKIHLSEEFKEFDKTSLDISYLSSGIYFVKVASGKEILVKKIIKE
ncbi:MAG: T9SS type A sorting domain-containing protein, partial [Flavisolibacter sp.]